MRRLAIALALVTTSAGAQTVIPSDDLLSDVEIAERAYTTLHPGLYRYNTPAEVEAGFDQLRRELATDRTLAEAYLAFSKLLASFRCGHTYANFWNQTDTVQAELFDSSDKVPFHFVVLDGELVVTESALAEPALPRGTRIVAIDGVPVRKILSRLASFVRTDGSNQAPLTFDLRITGEGEFEPFDIFFPLLYPPGEARYHLSGTTPDGQAFETTVPSMSRPARLAAIVERHGPRPAGPDDLWSFEILNDTTGYLRAGSFVTWKMELDWRAFLDEAFSRLRDEGIERLIVDVRGNGGGDNAVLDALLSRLLPTAIEIPSPRQRMRYETVPEDLAPYLDTWNPEIKNLSGRVRDLGDGYYGVLGTDEGKRTIGGEEGAFDGRVALLIDPANSSATFTLARVLQDAGAAVLVGQPTGGNRKGINGGQMFFLRLPGSGLEMDIPLIGYFPAEEQPDRGIEPDVLVVPTVEDVREGRDPALEAALEAL